MGNMEAIIMLISTKGRYALRILVDMAEHKGNGYIKLKDIAERQGISEKYLESIVKQLVINHIVVGLRGKGGGYRLNKEPDAINVGEVLRFMEGSLAPVACLEDGGEPCPRVSKCRTVGFWRGLDETIRRYTDSFTVADLMRADNSGYDYVI